MQTVAERFVSVDIEASGPVPSTYSMLAIGACLVSDPERGFSAELQPVTMASTPQALSVSGLSLERLAAEGLPPEQAMAEFAAWLDQEVTDGPAVFIGFNAAFDWMFVSEYFHRYLGRNPFGHAALDIKSYFMGAFGTRWDQTWFGNIAQQVGGPAELTHDALHDAQDQARLFAALLAHGARVPRED